FQSGFYYKTFMGPTKGSWMFYEPFIRNAAGLGQATRDFDPDRYETRYNFCEVLVIGAGATGIAAALSAAAGGGRVVLVEQDSTPGGGLLSDPTQAAWLHDRLGEIGAAKNIRVLTRTSAVGVYD